MRPLTLRTRPLGPSCWPPNGSQLFKSRLRFSLHRQKPSLADGSFVENTALTEPTPETASRWEDFVDIFISPGDLFRRRANDSWIVPLVAVAVFAMVVYFGFPSVQRAFSEAQIAQMIAKRPELAERMQGRGSSPAQHIIGGVIMPIAMTIGILLAAFITWLVTKITSVDLTWRKALMINAWIAIIG